MPPHPLRPGRRSTHRDPTMRYLLCITSQCRRRLSIRRHLSSTPSTSVSSPATIVTKFKFFIISLKHLSNTSLFLIAASANFDSMRQRMHHVGRRKRGNVNGLAADVSTVLDAYLFWLPTDGTPLDLLGYHSRLRSKKYNLINVICEKSDGLFKIKY